GVITQPFTTISETDGTLFISGSGEAYQNPCGGKGDIVYGIAAFENQEHEIDHTQKLGEDICYLVVLDDETVWIKSSQLITEEPSNDSQENENAESDKQVGDDNGANEPEKSDEVKDDEQQNEENSEDEIEKDHQDDGKLEEDEADANHT